MMAIRRGMRKATWQEACASARRLAGRAGLGGARDEQAQSLVEFALVFPILMTILLGIMVFGVALSNYLSLTNGTEMGTQALAMSRGQTSDPCKTASAGLYAAAPTLSAASLKFTIVLDGTAVASGAQSPSCSSSADLGYMQQGQAASVTVTYPCNLKLFNYNPAPNCLLTAQTTEVIQ